MQPSNPFSFWINGNEQKSFTYVNGRRAFYISVTEGAYRWMDIILFANSFKHVKRILSDLVKFETECLNIRGGDIKEHRHVQYLALNSLLDPFIKTIKGYTLNITVLDKTQAHRVSWASNDTI